MWFPYGYHVEKSVSRFGRLKFSRVVCHLFQILSYSPSVPFRPPNHPVFLSASSPSMSTSTSVSSLAGEVSAASIPSSIPALSAPGPKDEGDAPEVMQDDLEPVRRTGRKRQEVILEDYLCEPVLPKSATAAAAASAGSAPPTDKGEVDMSSDDSDSSSDDVNVKKRPLKLNKTGICLLKQVMNSMDDEGHNPMTNHDLSREQKEKCWKIATERFNKAAIKDKATRSLEYDVEGFKGRVQHQYRIAKDRVSTYIVKVISINSSDTGCKRRHQKGKEAKRQSKQRPKLPGTR